MPKIKLYLVLLLFSWDAAAACLSPPKANLTTNEVLIQIVPVGSFGEVNVILAWPTTTPKEACCMRTGDASRQWQAVLGQQIARGAVTLTDFVVGVTPPGSDAALTPAEAAICQTMTDRIHPPTTPEPIPPAVPAVFIVVSPISGQTDRPLYSAQFITIGRVEFTLNGSPRVCEPTPVLKAGSTVKYYYVTNNAGARGLAVCKPG